MSVEVDFLVGPRHWPAGAPGAAAIAALTGQQTALLRATSVATGPTASAVAAKATTNRLAQLCSAAQRVVRSDFATRMSPDPWIGATRSGASKIASL